MEKDEAKKIISTVYHDILHQIDTKSLLDADILMDFVDDAAKEIVLHASHKKKNIDFKNASLQENSGYKELAKMSINSYAAHNSNIQEISQNQDVLISNLDNIGYNLIEGFGDVQKDLHHEITKANETISDLMSKIKHLEARSSIDSLTKVYNRYALNEYISQLFSSDYNHFNNTFVMVIDIDDFKTINDTFGHLAGDRVLIFLANLLKGTLRDNDKIFRFGGEEFILIFTRMTSKQAKSVAQRIMDLIHKNKIIYKSNEIDMTISIGLTKMLENDTYESFIGRADAQMYAAKEAGKDQVKVDFNGY
ncbi:MAG: GGDEF domain-containing protein [Campylobacterota bacterium]|nr:GGDEF domain-containing protein [Campylobacterota bacterium]